MSEKKFPILSNHRERRKNLPTAIPWSVAEKAYPIYAKDYGGSGQSLERVAERGGFAASEMDLFYPEWISESEQIFQLQSQLTTAQKKIEELEKSDLLHKELNRKLANHNSDLSEQLSISQAREKKVTEQRDYEIYRTGNHQTGGELVVQHAYNQELNQIGTVKDPRDIQIKVLEKKLEKAASNFKELSGSYRHGVEAFIDRDVEIYNNELSAITPESLDKEC